MPTHPPLSIAACTLVLILGFSPARAAGPAGSAAARPSPAPAAMEDPTTSDILNMKRAPVSGNPGAVNFSTGDGFLQSLTPLKPSTGITFGGIWLSDYNILMSGGAQPGTSSWNSLLIASMQLDAEKLVGWK